ncbi:hypothetical protein [Pantoea sp. ME81]|uniref:hypothetical protein n=1 Tax=Pantoea sp. ME81 TaxID=2743935 RepID=UPI0015F3D15B|nr:hypothetical protein [Pantoea sp. ME81]
MLENYYSTPLGGEHSEHQRLIAVSVAVDIIKASLSTESGPRNHEYEVKQLSALIGEIADKIQAAIENK